MEKCCYLCDPQNCFKYPKVDGPVININTPGIQPHYNHRVCYIKWRLENVAHIKDQYHVFLDIMNTMGRKSE